MQQPIHFPVRKPFKYANGSGVEIECNFIALLPPTGKVSHTCCAIESMVQSSVLKMADLLDADTVAEAREAALAAKKPKAGEEEEAEDEPVEQDGDAILSMMVGSGVDMNKLVLHFRELFKEVAMMGAEKKMTANTLDKMDHRDLRKMIGVYTANFILN